MGYFANSSEGLGYEAKYCARCMHGAACPVLELHMLWNYDQCSDNEKALALDLFIPRDGIWNEQCRMFVENTHE